MPGRCYKEPYSGSYEFGSCGAEAFILCLGAGKAYGKGLVIIKAEHANEALAVDPVVSVANSYGKGLDRGNFHKLPDISKGTDGDMKFPHENPSNAIQTHIFRL